MLAGVVIQEKECFLKKCTMTFALKPRWERRKDARPQELLAAALDLFVERGFTATRLDEVARNAGVSKGTLYLYFENKEELFKAVVRENVVPGIVQAEQLMEHFDGSTEDLFRAMITLWWTGLTNSKLAGICKLMFAEAGNFPELAKFYHDEVIVRHEQMLIKLLERGMCNGEFRQLDITVMPKIITAPIIMLMLWTHSFCVCQVHPTSVNDYIESYVESVLLGLRNHSHVTPLLE